MEIDVAIFSIKCFPNPDFPRENINEFYLLKAFRGRRVGVLVR